MHPNTALQLLSGQLPIDDLALLLPSRHVTGAQITRALATDTSVLRFITLSTADGPVRLLPVSPGPPPARRMWRI